MERDELSFGKELMASVILANSPLVVVPALTTTAPDGGEVREPARVTWQNERMATSSRQREGKTPLERIFGSGLLTSSKIHEGLLNRRPGPYRRSCGYPLRLK
jgi:hypothetical protein